MNKNEKLRQEIKNGISGWVRTNKEKERIQSLADSFKEDIYSGMIIHGGYVMADYKYFKSNFIRYSDALEMVKDALIENGIEVEDEINMRFDEILGEEE